MAPDASEIISIAAGMTLTASRMTSGATGIVLDAVETTLTAVRMTPAAS